MADKSHILDFMTLPIANDAFQHYSNITLTKAASYIPDLETSEWCMIFLSPLLYWVVSTMYFVLSKLKLTKVELHRIPTNQKMRPKNRVTVKEVVVHVAIQHVLQCATATYVAYLTRPEDIATRKMEGWPLLFLKLVLAALFLDTYQYWWHRWMHVNKWLYRNFHSVHHRLTVPYAYGALYNHPIEGFIMDILGSAIASMLLDMHPWTSTIFFCLATYKTCSDHCGYTLPWDPALKLFPNNAAYHDIHHWGKGRMYNFSQPFFTFWDHWMGTDYETCMKQKKLSPSKKQSSDDEAISLRADAGKPSPVLKKRIVSST